MANGGIAQVDLVGNSRGAELITSATDKMVEGLRAGFITANDIIERGSERNKAKEKMEIALARQATADATDPALIEARRSQQLLAGEQAQQTRDLLPTARRATEEKLFGDINSGQIQRYGLKEKLAALNELGFAPSPDPDKGITPEFAAEVNKNFASLLRWQKDKADAKFELANIKQGEVSLTSGVFAGPTDILTAAPVDPKKVDELRARAGKTLPEFLRDAPPGGIVQPVAVAPAPIATPTVVAATTPLIQPVAAAPAASPVIQPAVSGAPPGFVQIKPATSTEQRPTEGQQRALLAVPRFEEANKALNNLQAKGYDPTSWFSWVDSYLPQIIKTGNRKEFETAMSVWSQGLLRLESGAAITPKEQGWYEKAFFPIVGDPPTVLRQKEALRRSVEGMVAELGSAGPISEDLKQRAQRVFQAAETFATGGSPVATPTGATPPATPAAAPVFALTEASKQPSGTIFKDAAGNWRRKL